MPWRKENRDGPSCTAGHTSFVRACTPPRVFSSSLLLRSAFYSGSLIFRVLSRGALSVLRVKHRVHYPKPKPSGHEETDESRDAEEKEDNDCPINRAKPGFFRVVGRDERSIKNRALPAHVVSNPGHATVLSMGRATGYRRRMNKKITWKRRARQDLSWDLTAKKRAGAPGVKRAVSKPGGGGQAWLRPGARKARAYDRKF